MRYELTDHDWAAIKAMLPNKPRGVAAGERPACPHPPSLRYGVISLPIAKDAAKADATP